MSSLADFRGWEVERDWEREGEARGCEIVCMCVGVHVGTCVDAGGGGGGGGGGDGVRYVMHY